MKAPLILPQVSLELVMSRSGEAGPDIEPDGILL